MSTRDDMRDKADELEKMSEKLHAQAQYWKSLADKVDELEKKQSQSQ